MALRRLFERLFGPIRVSRSYDARFSGAPVSSGVRAENIVNEYGRALARIEEFPLGAPASLLPRRKEEVAAAIVHYTKSLFRADMLTAKTYDTLHTGYRELAHFIPDREAHAGATAWAALQSGDSSGYSDETARAMERHQKILDEKTRRGAQFETIMAREGISMG
jgi:hypothetical protein